MNWKRIHDQIIKRAQNRTLEGYSELHHILPKCLGGNDNKNNLIKLTAREHFIIHKILNILHPEIQGLKYAVWIFVTFNDKRGIRISSREYERLRKLFAESASNASNKPLATKINLPFFTLISNSFFITKSVSLMLMLCLLQSQQKRLHFFTRSSGTNHVILGC